MVILLSGIGFSTLVVRVLILCAFIIYPFPEKSRSFGKIHKFATNVLAVLHTFLINNLLIFNFFSVIMYIQRDAKTVSHPPSSYHTFIFLPLFSFRKGPELTGHQPRVLSIFRSRSSHLYRTAAFGGAPYQSAIGSSEPMADS